VDNLDTERFSNVEYRKFYAALKQNLEIDMNAAKDCLEPADKVKVEGLLKELNNRLEELN